MEDNRFWQVTNLERPLDWRHQNAKRTAAAGGMLLPRQGDRLTRRLGHYLLQERLAAQGLRPLRPRPNDSVLAALDLARTGSSSMICAIESLILADVKASEIAARFGVKQVVIENYEKLFFDARTRLRRHDLMYALAIAPEIKRGDPQDAEDRRLQKLVGLICGVAVLDYFFPTQVSKQNPWIDPVAWAKRLAAKANLQQIFNLATAGDMDEHLVRKLNALVKELDSNYAPSSSGNDARVGPWRGLR